MIRGQMCARVGCGDTNTKPYKIAGFGGKAYTLHLCPTHRKDLIADGTIDAQRTIEIGMILYTRYDIRGVPSSRGHAPR